MSDPEIKNPLLCLFCGSNELKFSESWDARPRWRLKCPICLAEGPVALTREDASDFWMYGVGNRAPWRRQKA